MSLFGVGITLIVLGLGLLPFGYRDYKDDLKEIMEESSALARCKLSVVTFIDLLDFDSYLGWLLSTALLLVLSGGALIIFAIFQ